MKVQPKKSEKKITPSVKKPVQKKPDPEMLKLVSDLNRKFGANAIQIGFKKDEKTNEVEEIKRLPTSIVSLDIALGGGIPLGRYTQISGSYSSTKSTLSIHIVREAQKAGLVCAFLDAEGTTDDSYLNKLGVDTSRLFYSRPDGLEECTQMILDFQRSRQVHLAIFDSIEASPPTKEYESDMEDTIQMGVKQKLLGEFFRKYQAGNNRLFREGATPFTIIALNQLREKMGGYGDVEYCLHYDTVIPFVDGRSIPIGEVVEKKIQGKVWSFNEATQTFEQCEIVGWKDNGIVDSDREYIHFDLNGVDSLNGRYGITVTYDHKLLTESRGWVPANAITMKDKLLTKVSSKINGTLADFLFGTFCGDCSIVSSKKNKAFIRFQDKTNPDYAEWKAKKVSEHIPMIQFPSSHIWRSSPSVEFSEYKDLFDKRSPYYFLSHFSSLGLALWYMDDGSLHRNRCSICIRRFANNTYFGELIQRCFAEVGYTVTFTKTGILKFDSESSYKLMEEIHTFVPECMQYKLLPVFQGLYQDFTLTCEEKYKAVPVDILDIRYASTRQMKRKHRYDIEVEKHHNFIAGGSINGVVVHNTPGGRAKDFTASVDLRLRRGDWITEGKGESKEIVGQTVKFKIDKNKTFKRMQTGEIDFYFSENDYGIPVGFYDNQKAIIMEAVEWGLIERSGAWFYLNGNKDLKFQGVESVITYLRDHPEWIDIFKNQILKLNSKVGHEEE